MLITLIIMVVGTGLIILGALKISSICEDGEKYKKYIRQVKEYTKKQAPMAWEKIVPIYKINPDRWVYKCVSPAPYMLSSSRPLLAYKMDNGEYVGILLNKADWKRCVKAHKKYLKDEKTRIENDTLQLIISCMQGDVQRAIQEANSTINSIKEGVEHERY